MSDPYREVSKVPVYFDPPIVNISFEENKLASESAQAWRGLQIFSFVLMAGFGGGATYGFPLQIYWPAAIFVITIIFTIYCGHHAKFNRNIVLEYARRQKPNG